MAPEIVQKLEYAGPPADIWALGVLLFTLLSGCFPYRGATDKELYKKIMRADYKLPPEVQSTLTPEAVNLLRRIFTIDADKRPSARDLLNDPWLISYEKKEHHSNHHQGICPPNGIVRSHSHQPEIQTSKSPHLEIAQEEQARVAQAKLPENTAYSAYFGGN